MRCVPNPHVSSASLQTAGQGSLCRLLLPKKLLLHSPSLPTLLTLFGTLGLPFAVPSPPLIQVASTTTLTTTEDTPFRALLGLSRPCPRGLSHHPAPSPLPAKGVGDGHTLAPRCPTELHPLPPVCWAPGLTLPVRMQGSRKGGCEWGGGGPRALQLQRGAESEAGTHCSHPFCPSSLRPGRVGAAEGGLPGRLGTRQGPHPSHSLEDRLPSGLELRALPHPPRQLQQPPAEVRLHLLSLEGESEGCLLLGCEREKVRDHLARWARAPGAGGSRAGWAGVGGNLCRGRRAGLAPTPRGFQKGTPTHCRGSSLQLPTRRRPRPGSVPCGAARMPPAEGSAGPRVDRGARLPALRKLPVGAGGQGNRKQGAKHNSTTATRNGCRGGKGRRARVSPAWGWSEVRARSEKELSQEQNLYEGAGFHSSRRSAIGRTKVGDIHTGVRL